MEEKDDSKNISEDIINLVVARLKTIPPNIELSIGNEGSFTIDELIKRVMEQDDMNNWQQCTEAAKSPAGRRYLIHQAMGLGHDKRSEIIPGQLNSRPGEGNQRAFYARWAEIMDAPSWDQIGIAPRTKILM